MEEGRQVRDAGLRAYWRANKVLIAILLTIWALVSLVFSILLAEPLYGLRVGSLPMSFWWAQQGSMVVFVILIFVYAWYMDHLDSKHDVHEDRPVRGRRPTTPAGPPSHQPPLGAPDIERGDRGGDR